MGGGEVLGFWGIAEEEVLKRQADATLRTSNFLAFSCCLACHTASAWHEEVLCTVGLDMYFQPGKKGRGIGLLRIYPDKVQKKKIWGKCWWFYITSTSEQHWNGSTKSVVVHFIYERANPTYFCNWGAVEI